MLQHKSDRGKPSVLEDPGPYHLVVLRDHVVLKEVSNLGLRICKNMMILRIKLLYWLPFPSFSGTQNPQPLKCYKLILVNCLHEKKYFFVFFVLFLNFSRHCDFIKLFIIQFFQAYIQCSSTQGTMTGHLGIWQYARQALYCTYYTIFIFIL